ncbi:CLUMA_CG011885, isoform B [Clunio marinus]|uniref:CLUMA_CG011885, isoform B n=1 Tax=Clunio marinus TaxID=568069 RepID=A0A1J1IHM1_9DIPT|nr:CLUMA_CG011885, isoform B [Clunio marinus]
MLNSLKLYTNNWKIARFLVIQANYGSATSSESVDPSTFLKKEKTSKAMKAYLERSREHDLFMKQQQHEFEIGKRHLANMMGEPPENFDSQEKIDEAIRYLFPSALYEKRARPMMKPPEEIFPQRKAAEFDEAGRPFHSLFYTGKPNFFQLLHNIVACTNDCNNFEDRMIRQQKAADPSLQLDLSSTQWLTQEQLELKLMETIKPIEYDNFVNAMVRLGNHPYSYRHKDFMDIYRRPITNQSITLNVPKPKVDESGRSYITVYGCCRKSARGHVTIRAPGTGKISINGEPITFFEYDQAREQQIMENLGYKEGSTKPKIPSKRRMSRVRASIVENEALPLSLSPRFKNAAAASMVRWRQDPEAMIEEEFPSEDFEYMEVGPSPPAESAPSTMYDSFEEPTTDLSIQISRELIRNNLVDQLKALGKNGDLNLLEDIEQGNIVVENCAETLAETSKMEKNILYLWCAFVKRWDLLELVIKVGADIHFCDQNGYTAIHLAAFSGCLSSVSFLLSRRIDVNYHTKCFTPLHFAAFGNSPDTAKMLINNGAKVINGNNNNTAKPSPDESLLHCAVRANSVQCLKLFIEEGCDVNQLRSNGTNAIHLAADLGQIQCLEVLLNAPKADPNIRICIREKESTALHLAADDGNVECVSLLLSKGADAKVKNHRGLTPLHLAARTSSLEVVEVLLRDGNADPNAEDFDHRTPLHAAVGKSDSAFDILETLISWGANVNAKDVYGFTALHLAALDSLAHCVEMLIYHGADVSTKSRKGTTALNVINRKTPASLAMVNQIFDEAITLTHSQENSNREVELELDFRSILQHCHPREISYLNTFVDEGNKEILQHPLCSAFLYIKWGKIRKYYIARLLFCFTFVLFLTLYVLTALAHNCYNGSKEMEETIQEQELCQKQSILGDLLRNNPFVMDMQWWVLVAITMIEVFRKFYGITGYSSFKYYIRQIENIIEWFVICSVFVISHVYTDRTYTWQNHIGAFAVLLGWTNLMLMIGQLPALGAYVAMYTKVQKEFAKLFAAYSCMLIGFTISFCVIFPSSSAFANPFMGFITVLVMMTGENDVSILVNDPDGKDPPFFLEVSAQVTFVLFVMFVTVVLMNLLVGIAVNDIQGLRKTADLSKLVRQTQLISYIESALFNGWLPNWLRSLLHYTALVSPQAYRVVLSVRPLNPGEKRLPRHILMSAYEKARTKKHTGNTVSVKNSTISYFTYKNKLENNSSNALMDRSVDSDYFETESLCTLTNKIEENAEKIDQLSNEIRELKNVIGQDRTLIERLIQLMSTKTIELQQLSTEQQ